MEVHLHGVQLRGGRLRRDQLPEQVVGLPEPPTGVHRTNPKVEPDLDLGGDEAAAVEGDDDELPLVPSAVPRLAWR